MFFINRKKTEIFKNTKARIRLQKKNFFGRKSHSAAKKPKCLESTQLCTCNPFECAVDLLHHEIFVYEVLSIFSRIMNPKILYKINSGNI